MIRFQLEPLFSIINDLPALFIEHHKIVKQPYYKDLKIDWQRYLAMEQAGTFHIMTARYNGKLVGYIFFNTIPHILYSDILHCFTDIYFLHPDYRKGFAGIKMFKTYEKILKDNGIKIVYINFNIGYNKVEKLLIRLGYEPGEKCLIKKVA